VREALFSIITARYGSFAGLSVLDIFAGTGGMGIEALSRGASSATFIDSSREAVQLVRKNLHELGLESVGRVVEKDALQALKLLQAEGARYDIVFLDPPYSRGLTVSSLNILASTSLIDCESLVVAEFSSRENIPAAIGHLSEVDRRIYGDTAITLMTLGTTA
jgi:16S rRNA (guanine(966)-N(2))-methyltransferase RsmD